MSERTIMTSRKFTTCHPPSTPKLGLSYAADFYVSGTQDWTREDGVRNTQIVNGASKKIFESRPMTHWGPKEIK